MNVLDTITALIEREGGERYTDHPSDRGGPTRFGVTQAVARAFGYLGDMRLLPRGTAVQIFLERYWLQPKFDQVNAIAPAVAEELLDTGVNMGTGIAARFLQRALNTLNNRGALFPDLTADGSIGKMTIYALRTFIDTRGSEGRATLLKMLNSQQGVRYMEIAEADQAQEIFMYGWQKNRG